MQYCIVATEGCSLGCLLVYQGLEEVGVELDPTSKKVIGVDGEQVYLEITLHACLLVSVLAYGLSVRKGCQSKATVVGLLGCQFKGCQLKATAVRREGQRRKCFLRQLAAGWEDSAVSNV